MTTNFDDIKFNKKYHTYTLNGRKLTSVTKKLAEVKPPFDADAIAARVAAKTGQSVEEVKAEWQAKRDFGTMVHERIAAKLRGQEPTLDDAFLKMNEIIPELVQFDRFWVMMVEEARFPHIEWVIGDAELALGGTIDAVAKRLDNGSVSIWDWKTGKFNYDNSFADLRPPFDEYPASEFYIYSLQLNLYRLIIERNTDIEIDNCYIVHLTPDGYQIHVAQDMRSEIATWLGAE